MATYNLAFPDVAIDAILTTAYHLQQAGYIFRGSASDYSGTPTEREWVIAPAGFTGLGLSSAVPQGSIGVCLYTGTAWVGKIINVATIDSTPTQNSGNAVSSGGAYAAINQLSANVTEALGNLTFTDTTSSAFQDEYINMKVSTTEGGVERILTYLTILAATTSKAGLLSAEDKVKIDSFLANLRSLTFADTTASADQGTKITETLKATIGGVQEVIDSITLLAATSSKAGLLSASDKAYIDALPATLTNLSNSISGALALMQSLVGYYVCDTAAGTAAKTVAATGYSLTNGGCIRIKMTNANTADNATLNINSTGAKALYYDGMQASSTNTWEAGEVLEVYYDGTQYQCASGGGGKFATGENVKDISISQTVSNDESLVTGSAVTEYVNTDVKNDNDADLDISDAAGNVLLRLAGGHIKTSNFDSEHIEDVNIEVIEGNDSDLDISDQHGNVLVRMANGGINTKNFNSQTVQSISAMIPAAASPSNLLATIQYVNSVVSPAMQYIPVNTFSDLPPVGATNAIYVVANWDGVQVDSSKYAQYAWNGTGYLLLSVSSNGNGNTKKDIKILFIGNSLTQDAVSYLPLLLREIAPDIKFKLYDWYNAGITLQNQYNNYFLTDANASIFSVYESENQQSWTNYENSKNISWVMNNCDFDVVVLQEYSYYTFTEANETTYYNNIANFLQTRYSKALKFATFIDAPNRSKVEAMFSLAQQYASWHLKNTNCQSVISPGAAVYYALQTSLDSLGDQGHLSPDGTHTQEGLPCLLQSYVIADWIFEQLGIAKSICGSKVRITQEVWEALNPVGPNLGSGIITGTEEQHAIAQSCAIKAVKLAKKIEINTLMTF